MLHTTLNNAGKEFGIAVAAAEFSASISYDIPNLHPHVDFINLMTYDFHGSWNNFTGITAPLYASAQDTSSFQRQLNVNASVHYWISQGAPRDKIILGMPAYGNSFSLIDPTINGINSPSNGPGAAGNLLNQTGYLGYNEICLGVSFRGWTNEWENSQMVPFAHQNNLWVGYDNLASIQHKLDFIKNMNLGGAMFWSIDTEDFNNACGQGPSPLIRLAMKTLNP
jgi:chitinase